MIRLALDVLALAALLTVAVLARRTGDVASARRIGIIGSSAALLATVLGAIVRSVDVPMIVEASSLVTREVWMDPLPVYVTLIGLVAIGASPVFDLRAISVSRMALINACSLALLLIGHPLALALLWTAAALPIWRSLRERSRLGGPRVGADRVFAFYMLPSGALVLTGSVLLWLGELEVALLLLALGIAIREAIVPVHSWFPDLFDRAPLGLVVAFTAPQLGVYAHLRWIAEPLPNEIGQFVALLGAVTAIVAALLGAVQIRARRALGYLMMSQTALVAFGLETHSQVARTGTLVAWMVSGVAVAGFAMTLAALEARRGPLRLDRPSGSFERVPRLSSAFLLLGLASVGLPGTLGFIAEDLLVQGSVHEFPVLAFALIIATAINGITVMRAFFMLFMGTSEHAGEQDLVRRESVILSLVLASLFAFGLWPSGAVRGLGEIGPREHANDDAGDLLMPALIECD
jgi:NADH-quinone oxidoreductase subunit M